MERGIKQCEFNHAENFKTASQQQAKKHEVLLLKKRSSGGVGSKQWLAKTCFRETAMLRQFTTKCVFAN